MVINEYKDLIAFHPGYYLNDIIDDLGITQEEFAMRVGTSGKNLSELLHGQISLSNEMAIKLSRMLGTSVEFWLNLQMNYNLELIKIEQSKVDDQNYAILDSIDYPSYAKVFKLPVSRSKIDKANSFCRLLEISDLSVLAKTEIACDLRKASINQLSNKNIININIWLMIAKKTAQSMKTESFSLKKLNGVLPRLRAQIIQPQEKFLPEIKFLFSSCGVSFVILPYVKNLCIRGAVFYTGKGTKKPVLAINNRDTYTDQFWFSLFHEIGHIFQERQTYLSYGPKTKRMISEDERMIEIEADNYAREHLLPESKYGKFISEGNFEDSSILSFAEDIDVTPGIIIGRLQHDENLKHNKGNHLRSKLNAELLRV